MNVFEYANWCESNWKRNLSDLGNYKPFTTFFSDLSIAEFVSGAEGVKDTFNRVVKSWKSDYKYFTEFVMCLNHKSWEMYARSQNNKDIFSKKHLNELGQLYTDLYNKADDMFYKAFANNKEAQRYYFEITD